MNARARMPRFKSLPPTAYFMTLGKFLKHSVPGFLTCKMENNNSYLINCELTQST